MKVCRKCRKSKHEDCFHVKRRNKDGLDSMCKECKSSYEKSYYKSKINQQPDYYSKYPSKIKVKLPCKVCGKMVSRSSSYSGVNYCSKDCKYVGNPPDYFKYYYNQAFKRASKTGKEFNLTPSYLEELFYNTQGGVCSIIGNELKLCHKSINTYKLHEQASLDRIDNSRGYVKGNVRFVSLGINYMKNRRNDDELYEMLRVIKKAELV